MHSILLDLLRHRLVLLKIRCAHSYLWGQGTNILVSKVALELILFIIFLDPFGTLNITISVSLWLVGLECGGYILVHSISINGFLQAEMVINL